METYLNQRLFEAIKTVDVEALQDVIRDFRCSGMYRLEFDKALCCGAKTGHSEIVRLILRTKADISYTDKDGRRALHYAAEIGSADILKQIINAGSPVNIADGAGATALHLAADLGHTNVVLLLLQEGAHVNRARLYRSGETPLHLACKNGHTDIAKILIARGADINATTYDGSLTPLHLAARGRHRDVTSLLCQLGAIINKPDGRGKTPMVWAAENGAFEIANILLDHGASPEMGDKNGRTALHTVAGTPNMNTNHLKIAETLIEMAQDLNQRDNEGCTALHHAAMAGNTDVAMLLVTGGADIDAMDEIKGETPLNRAICHNRTELASLLVTMGANVNIPDQGLVFPLHNIQGSRCPNKRGLLDILIEHGALLNSRTQRGYTPLERCVFHYVIGNHSNKRSLMALVVAGANLRPVTSQGPDSPQHNSPLCWLTWHGQLLAARFLVQSGWEINNESWLSLPGKNQQIEEFLDWLRELVTQPRCLHTVCRRAIREHLITVTKDTNVVPLIAQLPIPTQMKRYLILQDEVRMLEEDSPS